MTGTGGRATDGIKLINDISNIISVFFVVIAILVAIAIVFAIVKAVNNAKKSKKVDSVIEQSFNQDREELDNKKQQNWTCIYCGTDNKIEADKCSNCGSKKSKSVKDA